MRAASPVVHSDSEILGGTPVFVGTRVPFQALLDTPETGDSLDEFLANYPSVTREQAVSALEQAAGYLFGLAFWVGGTSAILGLICAVGAQYTRREAGKRSWGVTITGAES